MGEFENTDYKEKKKNRHRDRKKSTFVYGKGISKKKPEKVIKQKDQIQGIYSQIVGKNFGFIDVEGVDDGYFVIEHNKNGAFDGDEVIAELKTYRGKQEANIVHVVKRGIRSVVGELQMTSKKGTTGDEFGFVVPKQSGFESDIFIAGSRMMGAKHGDIVGVNILDYSGKNPSGEIIEILGKKGDKGLAVDSSILEAGFSQKFDDKLLESLSKQYAGDSDSAIKAQVKGRKDFRKLFTFTIDGEDAKDLDDAISIQKKENGTYKLYVHIADVAHYVAENSKLDKEAFKRGTSVYLTDRVIPMLPEILSNELCSLNIGSQKLTLTCEMTISEKGELVKSTVYESVINSDFRLTYKEVDEVVTHPQPLPIKEGENKELLFCGLEKTSELIETLQLAEELRSKITSRKNHEGVLNFDFPETKVILDENKKVVEIKEYPRFDSNKMIEEFMVMANEAVARKFSTYPFLYRIHEAPLDEDRAKLKVLLNLFGIDFRFKEFSTKEFGDLLELINNPDIQVFNSTRTGLTLGQKKFLEKSILRTLSKAVYSDDNQGHFGLGIKFYSHFTSPIRRYPDLQIHRIIKEKIQGKLDKARIIHYTDSLEKIAHSCSEQERKAEKLEYKVRDYYLCDFYKDKIGQQFEGVITTVLPYGCFVQLEDTSEGFIELIPKHGKGKGYTYNEQFMRFDNANLDIALNLGDSVKVELIEVDTSLLRINFDLKLS